MDGQEPQTPRRAITAIEDLMSLVSLRDVRTYAFSATATAAPAQDVGEAQFEFEYSPVTLPDEIQDRFRLQVTTADALYNVDVGAVFSLETACEIPSDIRNDFAERVGFMAAFPYIREAVSGLAARLRRQAPLFDLMRPGDLKITESDEQPESQ